VIQCGLCDRNLAPILTESIYWRLVLNRNQNFLGKCFLALNHHLEAVSLLSPLEWMDPHRQLNLATRALSFAFQPDHFNYAFLQNQDRHVHLHLIPRYAGPRTFAGVVFEDLDYPAHYGVPAPARHLTPAQFTLLADKVRSILLEALL
jgi:diadenosine tetraphosphate (Ap4A) HIT family hydrolase